MEINIIEKEEVNDNKIPSLNSFKTMARINPPIKKAPIAIPNKSISPPIEKKKVSYDDILTSMSMCVVDGKLQLVKNYPQIQPQQQNTSYLPNNKYLQQASPSLSLEQEPQPRLTKEQYKKLVILNYIKRQQAIQRINQIKSKKLLFPNPNVNITTSSQNMFRRPDMNRLFKLVGS